MRKLYLLLFTLFFISYLSAIKVSVSLDIIWKEKDLYIFDINEKTKVPFLNITYQNHSGDSIYFFNRYATSENYFSLIAPLSTYGLAQLEKTDEYFADSVDVNNVCKAIGKDYNFTLKLDNKEMKKKQSARVINVIYSYLYFNSSLKDDSLLNYIDECYNKMRYLLILQDSLNNKNTNLQISEFAYPNKGYISRTEAFYIGNNIEPKEFSMDSFLLYSKSYADSLKKEEYRKEIWERNYKNKEYEIQRSYTYLEPYGKSSLEFDLTILYLLKGNYTIIYPKHSFPKQLYFIDSTIPFGNLLKTKKGNVKYKKEAFIYYELPKKHNRYNLFYKKIGESAIELNIP